MKRDDFMKAIADGTAFTNEDTKAQVQQYAKEFQEGKPHKNITLTTLKAIEFITNYLKTNPEGVLARDVLNALANAQIKITTPQGDKTIVRRKLNGNHWWLPQESICYLEDGIYKDECNTERGYEVQSGTIVGLLKNVPNIQMEDTIVKINGRKTFRVRYSLAC